MPSAFLARVHYRMPATICATNWSDRAAVLAGALGFDCGEAGHSEHWIWKAWEQRRCCPHGGEGRRGLFLFFFLWYGFCGAIATGLSAAFCPTLGSGEGFGERFGDCWFAVVYAAGLSFLCLPLPLILVCVELGDMARAAQ